MGLRLRGGRVALLERPQEKRDAILARIPDRARRERHRRWVEHGVDNPDFEGAALIYRDTVDLMDASLAETEWLAGDAFSLADCALLPFMQAVDQMGWDIIYRHRAHVAAWLEKGRARKSFREQITGQLPRPGLERIRETGGGFAGLLADALSRNQSNLPKDH